MELFATDRDRLAFLLETDAALDLAFEALEAQVRGGCRGAGRQRAGISLWAPLLDRAASTTGLLLLR